MQRGCEAGCAARLAPHEDFLVLHRVQVLLLLHHALVELRQLRPERLVLPLGAGDLRKKRRLALPLRSELLPLLHEAVLELGELAGRRLNAPLLLALKPLDLRRALLQRLQLGAALLEFGVGGLEAPAGGVELALFGRLVRPSCVRLFPERRERALGLGDAALGGLDVVRDPREAAALERGGVPQFRSGALGLLDALLKLFVRRDRAVERRSLAVERGLLLPKLSAPLGELLSLQLDRLVPPRHLLARLVVLLHELRALRSESSEFLGSAVELDLRRLCLGDLVAQGLLAALDVGGNLLDSKDEVPD